MTFSTKLLKNHKLRITLYLIISFALVSCATGPEIVDRVAASYNFKRSVIDSEQFSHVVYTSNINKPSIPRLHIYLGGDGIPWLKSNIVSVDPTSRDPLILHLMNKDPSPSVYISRPCYQGYYQQVNCNPLLWTHQRYSETVVNSMAIAIDVLIKRMKPKAITLIGYSGGGVLAMLLSERLSKVNAVVTVAANLDIAAWTKRHDYTSLTGSLNPMDRIENYRSLKQYHLVGMKDTNVSSTNVASFVSLQKNKRAVFLPYDDFNHRCCWVRDWNSILQSLSLY